jgi:Zn-dependent M28 family amino/carboxypeptidase
MSPAVRLPLLALALVAAFSATAFSSASFLAPSSQDLHASIDVEGLLRDISVLAHDSMEGRLAGTPGNERARRYLVAQLDSLAIPTPPGGRTTGFALSAVNGDPTPATGGNVFALVEGTAFPDRYVVVSAHYDHLGVRNGQIYNGADDNASGTAALLALAELFAAAPPRHSLLFVLFDAEELGLRGSRSFIDHPPVPLASIALNINLDMVSRSAAGELYAAGTYHYPFLEPYVDEVAARSPISVLKGHDSPGLPAGDDWTDASDHAPFHEAGIPFIYFGVEDHEGYHQPSDDFESITPEFYADAVVTIADFLLVIDGEGGPL